MYGFLYYPVATDKMESLTLLDALFMTTSIYCSIFCLFVLVFTLFNKNGINEYELYK